MARPRKSRDDDPWKQRDRFMELVDKKAAEGVPLEEIAKAIGLQTTSSLEVAYRYDRRRAPKRTTVKLAAKYFGVPEAELFGDAEPETEASRARGFLLSHGMGADEVNKFTDHQVIDAFRVAIATAKAMLAK